MSFEVRQILRIGDFAQVKGGKRMPAGTALTSEKTSHPYLRIVDFKDGSIDTSNLQYVPNAVFPQISRYVISADDLYISIVGTIGLVGSVPPSLDGANLTENAAKICGIDGTRVNPRYLSYYLRSDAGQSAINALAVGSTQPKLALFRIEQIEVPIPSLNTQQSIADMLGALDDRITLLRETNATLEAIAQALFKSWFVDFDPVRAKMEGRAPDGMDEDTAALFPDSFEETELGLVPRGWSLAPLASVVKLTEGKPWIAKNRVHASDISVFGANGRIGCASEPLGEGRVIFLGKIGSCGAINAYRGLWWATNNAFYIDKQANPALEWCRQVLGGIDFKGYIGGSSNPYMPLKNFAHHPVICAPVVLQLLYEDFAGLLRTKIEFNSDQAEYLATLRDTLLPRLISGQVRLGTEADEGVA